MNGNNYFQFFIWESEYTYDDLVYQLEQRKPSLIEWIAPYEVAYNDQPHYKALRAYKSKYPDTEIRILTCSGVGSWTGPADGFIYESYPLIFFAETISNYGAENILNFKQPSSFKYKILSLNNNAHLFRCVMIDYFSKYKLLGREDCLITWRNKHMHPDYKFRWFEPRPIVVDSPMNEFNHINSYALVPQYHECLFNAVAESAPNSLFITEKTAKPILLLKPFITLGAKGCNKFLKEQLGFELFEEYINYDFDDIDDLELRVDMFAQQVVRLSELPGNELDTIYQNLLPKLQHNRQRVFDLIRSGDFKPKVITEWKKYRLGATSGDRSVTMPTTTRQDHWYRFSMEYGIE